MDSTDVLVVGSGIAGLAFALELAEQRSDLNILVVSKANVADSATQYAQGGIAIAGYAEGDSFDKHVEDTMSAGGYLSKRSVVEHIIRTGPDRLAKLEEWGVYFDRQAGSDNYDLALEGGHSHPRVLHSRDKTGATIVHQMLRRVAYFPNIRVVQHLTAIDLVVGEGDTGAAYCAGALLLDDATSTTHSIRARYTMLATGGCGRVFGATTNPSIATGDGVGIAWRAGCSIVNMRFIQFHPTALRIADGSETFLISEAVRGMGAYVVNSRQERFLFNYDSRGELATRDVVSQAIAQELNALGESSVWLDCRHLDLGLFRTHFPTIYTVCLDVGVNPATDLIPIVPAAHYQCGGIDIGIDGTTSLKNLLAAGECAHTGCHGSNRLASNSLLEALVVAHEAHRQLQRIDVIRHDKTKTVTTASALNLPPPPPSLIQNTMERLQQTMTLKAGIIRTPETVKDAQRIVEEIRTSIIGMMESYVPGKALYELRNMADVALLICKDAIEHGDLKLADA